ncbi:MAG: hypothetical protein ACK4YV_14440 [Emticicia sp.]
MNLKQPLFLATSAVLSTISSFSQTKFVEQKAGHVVYVSLPEDGKEIKVTYLVTYVESKTYYYHSGQ